MPRAAASLADELAAMTRLQALLLLEQTALKQGQGDALADLIPAKGQLIADIAALAEARFQRLVAIGMEPSENAMQSWIDSTGEDSEKKDWDALLALAKVVKEANRLNGIMIKNHMNLTQQTLALFESQISGGGSFYGPDGQSSVQIGTRTFGAV